MPVVINAKDTKRAISRTRANLRFMRKLYRASGIALRDNMRKTITLQGRVGAPFVPLTKLTRMRTGRRKALLGMRTFIKTRWTDTSAIVFFDSPGPFTLRQHEKGFRVGATKNKRMVIPNRTGGVLMFLNNRKAFSVPGRKVTPTAVEGKKIVMRAFGPRFSKLIKISWR